MGGILYFMKVLRWVETCMAQNEIGQKTHMDKSVIDDRIYVCINYRCRSETKGTLICAFNATCGWFGFPWTYISPPDIIHIHVALRDRHARTMSAY